MSRPDGAMPIPGAGATLRRGPTRTRVICPHCRGGGADLPAGRSVAAPRSPGAERTRLNCEDCERSFTVPLVPRRSS